MPFVSMVRCVTSVIVVYTLAIIAGGCALATSGPATMACDERESSHPSLLIQ